MPIVIGINKEASANGVVLLIPCSIDTLSVLRLKRCVLPLHRMFADCAIYYQMPWFYALGQSSRPLFCVGIVCWLLWTCLLRPVVWTFVVGFGILCSLMVPVCGPNVRPTVLLRGVLFWRALSSQIGLGVLFWCLAVGLCLAYAKLRSVANCLPWPLSSTMLPVRVLG